MALQRGGAQIIELGIPFSDPIADGKVIQQASFVARNTHLFNIFNLIESARNQGLIVPIVLMGYLNSFLNCDFLFTRSVELYVKGFIVVDLPIDEAAHFISKCNAHNLHYIPLIAPSTPESRIQQLVKTASWFIYVVSTMGVTGARTNLSVDLPNVISRIKPYSNNIPLAVGFGVSTSQHFQDVSQYADAVVIGSKIVTLLDENKDGDYAQVLEDFARSMVNADSTKKISLIQSKIDPITHHHFISPQFGSFGGQYAPESLISCLDEIEDAYSKIKNDPTFWTEFKSYYPFIGRPSTLHKAERLSTNANIWLKREDLNHTGSHKINNALGQILLAKRLGKKRIIAETGAGQHGVACATVCAKFGLECIIYMGAEDVRRQALNVFRIKLLGGTVVPVTSGSQTLKDAINEAMRDWVANVSTTHYMIGSAIGPHPFPTLVRDFQSVIGQETREFFTTTLNKLPDYVIACVGGGSNAIGLFHPFVNDESVRLIGVEAGGDGIETGHHSATLSTGRPGVLHGTRTYLMQDEFGQIVETHSISAGLDYPGVV